MTAQLRVSILVSLGLAALVVAGCGGGHSGPRVGSIEGYVFGQVVTAAAAQTPSIAVGRGPTPPAGYAPLAGAVVMVTGSSTIATTDTQGYFRIDNVLTGAQTVTVSHSGYLTAVVQVTVVAGQVVTVQDALLQPSERKWTFMVFLNGNNDLESYGILNVNQMEMVGSSPAVDIIVQMSRGGYDSTNGAWVGCRRMRIIKDSDPNIINSPVVQDLGVVDMGDWHVLHDFIVWAMTNYPAEHYCLVIWDHGAGWRAAAPTTRVAAVTRGVSFDWLSGHNITTAQLPFALDVQPRLDIIAWDASLMQMVEVGYQIRHYGGIMVGSEESPPGLGYPYQTFLAPLVATPTMLPADFASQIVTQTLDYYASINWTGGLTQSAVALDRMDNLALAVDGFARALATAMPTYSAQITAARTQAQAYAYPENKDLYDFARLINQSVPQAAVTQASQAVMTSITGAVFAEAHNTPRANSHGLAIFIPSSTNYQYYRPDYAQLEFATNTAWDEWLGVSPP
jgi:hypothetical protein